MVKIRIGHGSYTGANRLAVVYGKAAAVRELRERGFTRDFARDIINDMAVNGGFATASCYRTFSMPETSEVVEIEFNPAY